MYFNYHAKVKKLIKENQVTGYEIVDSWNNISPALVIYFKSHKPLPIKMNKWEEYLSLLSEIPPSDKS